MILVTPCGRHTSIRGRGYTPETLAQHVEHCRACQEILAAQVEEQKREAGEVILEPGDRLFEGRVLRADDFDLFQLFR